MAFTKPKVSPLKKNRDIKKARAILDLGTYHTEDDIKEAFKRAVHANHPDGQNGGEVDLLPIDKLTWAKRILMENLNG